MELIGKIFIVTLGIASVVGLLLLLAASCDIIANVFRETHKEYFADDSSNYFDDEDDRFQSPYYKIELKEEPENFTMELVSV